VVIALFLDRDQIALRDNFERRHIRSLIEELGSREQQNAVLLGDEEEAVFRKTDAIRNREINRRGKLFHIIGNAVLVTVSDRVDFVLACADKGHNALRADRHMARIRNDCIKIDLETIWHLDTVEHRPDRVGPFSLLRDQLHHRRSGRFERREFFEIALREGRGRQRSAERHRRTGCQ